jgi:hypothetical protein
VSETQKTAIYAGAAGLLLLLAVTTRAWGPSFAGAPEDEGKPFFPLFTDFTQATSLEVWDYDAEDGVAVPFKVELKDGVWRIPSKNGYPADGKDRLGKTAAAVMSLTRESLKSSREEDHAAAGVVDPTSEASGSEGRGRRITLRDAGGKTLADVILGKAVEGSTTLRYVRVPTEKQVYVARAGEVDPSTKFEDWIERDLMLLDVAAISTITIDKYSVDEQMLRQGAIRINQGEVVQLGKKDGAWTLSDQKADEKVAQSKVTELTEALDKLEIVDVTPFAEEALHSAGFFVTREQGVFSNEGEVAVDLDDGVRYTIRFGEVLPGEGADTTLRRYVVITTELNEKALPRGADGAVTPEARKKAEERVQELGERFGSWFYVISAKSYDVLRPARASLLDTGEGDGEDDHGGFDGHGPDDGHDHGGGEMFPPVPPEEQGPPAPPMGNNEPPQTPPGDAQTPPPGDAQQTPPPGEVKRPTGEMQTPPPGEGQTPPPGEGQTPPPGDAQQTPPPGDAQQTPPPGEGQTPPPPGEGQTPPPGEAQTPPPPGDAQTPPPGEQVEPQ